MDDAMYRAALIVFHHELGLPLIEAGRLASAVVVWSAETPKARAAALEEHGAALLSTGTGRSEAEAMTQLLREVEPSVGLRGNEVILYCPDRTVANDIYEAMERACYGATALNPPAREGEGDQP